MRKLAITVAAAATALLALTACGPNDQSAAEAAGQVASAVAESSPSPSKSNCVGNCLVKWPAVAWAPGASIPGIEPRLIGKVVRPDGTAQLTVGGWPAYRFWTDKVPGDIKGQGVGKTWWAITVEGKRAREVSVDSGSGY
jgi:predicted lipoprotein with Yx(FWY)xxD motif